MNPINPLRGESALEALLTFFGDQKKFQGYLKELQTERKRLNEVVEAHGKVKEIDKLHSAAERAAASAEQQKDEIINAAKESAEHERDLIKKAQQRVGDREKKCSAREADIESALADATKNINQSTSDLEKREKALAKAEAAVAQVAAEAQSYRDEYEEKANRARAIVGEDQVPTRKASSKPAVQ